MARTCTVCDHSELQEINRRLVSGDSIAKISQEFSVSDWALRRHQTNHVPKTLVASPSAQEIARADDLLQQVQDLRGKALALLKKAEAAQDVRACAVFLRELREQIKLLAELEGRLATQPQVNILVNNPEWIEIRTLVIRALEPYPEAKAAVINAINSR